MKSLKTLLMAVLVALVMVAITGCAPVKVLDPITIGPNETAWAIPLDGLSQAGQVKFNSVDFLNQKKVSAKRYMVDKVSRKIGRFYWDIEWMPSSMIIKVDRSLVTREWTDGEGKGTSLKSEGIGVVTSDSVKLRVGLTITASIEEDDASLYLYYHGLKGLAEVLDQNIRSFAVAELTRKYSLLTLKDAQNKGATIYQELFKDAQKEFETKGITIHFLGNSEGLDYADPVIQESINRSYTAQQERQTAQMEQEAQRIRNETTVMTAQATADAAQKTLAAQEASKLQVELDIQRMEAQAKLAMAQKWDGKLPESILPADSQFLFNIGAKPATK